MCKMEVEVLNVIAIGGICVGGRCKRGKRCVEERGVGSDQQISTDILMGGRGVGGRCKGGKDIGGRSKRKVEMSQV